MPGASFNVYLEEFVTFYNQGVHVDAPVVLDALFHFSSHLLKHGGSFMLDSSACILSFRIHSI